VADEKTGCPGPMRGGRGGQAEVFFFLLGALSTPNISWLMIGCKGEFLSWIKIAAVCSDHHDVVVSLDKKPCSGKPEPDVEPCACLRGLNLSCCGDQGSFVVP
jgi:hypothetical protein